MENATIVKLSPSETLVGVSTFEEAFGEHSEFKGRGRARRQKRRQARRLQRIHDRAERRKAKDEANADREDANAARDTAREAANPATDDASSDDSGSADDSSSQDPAAEDTGSDESADGFDGEYSGVTGIPPTNIDPKIMDLTNKIVWNQESQRRHAADMQRLNGNFNRIGEAAKRNPGERRKLGTLKEQIQAIELQIQKHKQREEYLMGILNKLYEGNPQIAMGMKLAQTNLQKSYDSKNAAEGQEMIKSTLFAMPKETVVEKSLNPQFGDQRIEIPASTTMNEATINADGNTVVKSPMPMGAKIIIGVAILGTLYYFAKKHKVI